MYDWMIIGALVGGVLVALAITGALVQSWIDMNTHEEVTGLSHEEIKAAIKEAKEEEYLRDNSYTAAEGSRLPKV